MNSFNIKIPKDVTFGEGVVNQISKKVLRYSKNRVLFLHGSASLNRLGILETIKKDLESKGIYCLTHSIAAEPTQQTIYELAEKNKGFCPEVILAVGGGSVIDCAKLICTCLSSGCSADELLNGNFNEAYDKIPLVAVPSTFGAGSEMNDKAFIMLVNDKDEREKKQFKWDSLLPDCAVIDPQLSLNTDYSITVSCGYEALSHLLEAYSAIDAGPFIDDLMPDAIERIVENLPRVCLNSEDDIHARSEIAYASVIAGIGCANTSLTVLSGFVRALGGLSSASSGELFAALLYPCTLVNMQRVQAYDPFGSAIEKYAKIGSVISGIEFDPGKYDVLLRYMSEKLMDLSEKLNVKPLGSLGVKKDDFYKIISNVELLGNPVKLSEADLLEILELAY